MVYCMVYAKLTAVSENEVKPLFYNELFKFHQNGNERENCR
ncbi:hypothetical protein yfred0001_11740 [Yersinia frederiksenii ATCC 33641]|nr:hypothetical protein yfred0001_11740 [Yersinia frederiksenii ATCC 33641]